MSIVEPGGRARIKKVVVGKRGSRCRATSQGEAYRTSRGKRPKTPWIHGSAAVGLKSLFGAGRSSGAIRAMDVDSGGRRPLDRRARMIASSRRSQPAALGQQRQFAGTLQVDQAQARSEPEVVRRPFCALDEASYHLDSVSEPFSVHLEVHLRGTIAEDRLRQAVSVALARHPRARARVTMARQRGTGYEWEITPTPDVDPLDVVVCADEDALQTARAELQSLAVPLVTSPPLRIRLARHRQGDVVMLNLHHAAGDGIAALRLLHSIARAYADRCDPVTDTPPEQVEIPMSSSRWTQLRALVGELRQAAPRSVHLALGGGEDRPGYRLHHRVLDTMQTAALATKTGAGTTVNDLLLAGLHLALDSWNSQHGGRPGRLSVLMPVNLRPKSSWYEVFGNFTFMVPVVTRPEDRSDPITTVSMTRRRTRRIKDNRTPAAVVRFLHVLQHLPHPAKRSIARLAASERVIPTAILSNLGRLDEDLDFGPELRAREVWFSPPARMPMGLAVGAVTAAGRLHLVFRYRYPLLGPAEAAGLADHYVAALGQVAAAARVEPTSLDGRTSPRPGARGGADQNRFDLNSQTTRDHGLLDQLSQPPGRPYWAHNQPTARARRKTPGEFPHQHTPEGPHSPGRTQQHPPATGSGPR
jgi:NRPS condensation-like uncharacterized protein